MWKYLKKNGLTIILGIGVVVLILNPGAKSWVLRQLMYTGIFNAHIQNEKEHAQDLTAHLEFTDTSGEKLNTDSLKGKVIFINFWASWCPPCRAEMPSIDQMNQKFKAHPDFLLLMVNEGEEFIKAKKYLKGEGYDFPVYRGVGAFPKTIYSGVLPTTVILDKEGNMRYHHTGAANYNSKKFVRQIDELLTE